MSKLYQPNQQKLTSTSQSEAEYGRSGRKKKKIVTNHHLAAHKSPQLAKLLFDVAAPVKKLCVVQN